MLSTLLGHFSVRQLMQRLMKGFLTFIVVHHMVFHYHHGCNLALYCYADLSEQVRTTRLWMKWS